MKDCPNPQDVLAEDGLLKQLTKAVIERLSPDTGPAVHMVSNSLCYVSHEHMQEVATDLKAIYSSATQEEAELNLELFAEKWDGLYPSISKSWRAQWARVIPLFAFPADIRRVI